jgi:hypothetical protein
MSLIICGRIGACRLRSGNSVESQSYKVDLFAESELEISTVGHCACDHVLRIGIAEFLHAFEPEVVGFLVKPKPFTDLLGPRLGGLDRDLNSVPGPAMDPDCPSSFIGVETKQSTPSFDFIGACVTDD